MQKSHVKSYVDKQLSEIQAEIDISNSDRYIRPKIPMSPESARPGYSLPYTRFR